MNKKRKAATLFMVLAIGGVIHFILSAICTEAYTTGMCRKSVEATAFPGKSAESTTVDKTSTNIKEAEAGHGNKKIQKIYKSCKKYLVLVNAQHALDTSYEPNLLPICHGRLSASKYLYDSLKQMLSDASQEGHHFWISSAYRSREKQQSLIDEDICIGKHKGLSYEEALQEAYKETMPPGHSEHETGLALDILCAGNACMDKSQVAEPGNQWLRKNCHKYGFILRYPEEKEAVTGVNYEPWHFRYVGERAAKYLREQDITLEEFWDRLNE